MNTPLDLISPSLWTQIYNSVTPPEKSSTEHPYEYITENFSDNTPNSKLTGLPGYSPPTFVRFLNGITYYSSKLVLVLAFQFLVVLFATIFAYVIESVSTIEFSLQIPLTGWTIIVLGPDFSLVMTPILLSLSIFVFGVLCMDGSNKVSSFVSEPYEKQYQNWLEDLKPVDNGYPASLSICLTDTEYDYGEIPEAAPLYFRRIRLFEKLIFVSKTSVIFLLNVFFQMMLLQNQLLYNSNINPENLEQDTIKQRRNMGN